jgi:signal transduction histidine kinase/ActR/RegA family two-component response regulator
MGESELTNRESLVFALPIQANYDAATVIGTLVGIIDWSYIQNTLAQTDISGAAQDADHLLILHSEHQRAILYRTDNAPTDLVNLSDTVGVSSLISDDTEYLIGGTLSKGREKFADPGWYVHAVVSADAAYASVFELRRQLILIALVLGAAVIFIGIVGANTLTTLLLSLRAIMAKLATGKLDTEVGFQSRRDEIGTMAKAVQVFKENAIYLVELKEQAEAAMEQAKSASKAKSAFLANMSHELRTPLNAIIGYSEMMLEDAQDEGAEERVSDLQKVRGSGRHLLGLINDILDISKIEANKLELNVASVEVAGVVSDVESTAAALMDANENQFTVEVPESIGNIECDSQRLSQILLNLLSNAAKFTEKGEISLHVERKDDGWVRFVIRDTGIGMSAEQVDRLFEPFVQADSSISQRFGGTGLGLSISLRFVEMMGGRINIESEPGVGSCFTVSLPDIRPLIRKDMSQGAGPLILVIEDNPSDQSLLVRELTRSGYKFEVAHDGVKGMAIAHVSCPAAIILDIEMPGMDGYQVLKALNADEQLRPVPVIVVTSHDVRHIVTTLGASYFLAKPIDREALHQTLIECCEGFSQIAASA